MQIIKARFISKTMIPTNFPIPKVYELDFAAQRMRCCISSFQLFKAFVLTIALLDFKK